jgi:hypothetical protein
VSIGAFCFGTLCFNALHRYPTGFRNQPTSRRRWIFITSLATQSLFIAISAILVTLDLVSRDPFRPGAFSSPDSNNPDGTDPNFLDLLPIAFLAFEASGQVCLSRVMGVIELPTIVLSTLYHDFTADLYGIREAWQKSTSIVDFLFVQQRRQGKRFGSILALFVGAIVGSEMFKSKAGMAAALWMAAALKFTLAMPLFVWRKDSVDNEQAHSPA